VRLKINASLTPQYEGENFAWLLEIIKVMRATQNDMIQSLRAQAPSEKEATVYKACIAEKCRGGI